MKMHIKKKVKTLATFFRTQFILIRKFNEGIIMFDRAIQINPNNAQIYYLKGLTYSLIQALTLF